MAAVASDDSEEDIANAKTNSAKKIRLASSSSSDGDRNVTPVKDGNPNSCTDVNVTSRSFERIRRRRSKSFTMPSKHEVWDAIPSTKTPEKVYDGLKPRKIVNNFTRVTHRYNYDPAYTSEEDSCMGGFLVDDRDVSSCTSSDSDFLDDDLVENEIRKRRKKHRIKNRRIVQPSSDSDSQHPADKPDSQHPADKPDSQGGDSQTQGGELKSRLREKILSRCNSMEEGAVGLGADNGNGNGAKDLITLGLKKAKAMLASSSEEETPKDNKPECSRRRDKRGRKRKCHVVTSGLDRKSDDADDEGGTSVSDKSVVRSKCADEDVNTAEPGTSGVVCDDVIDSDSVDGPTSKRKSSGVETDSESSDSGSGSDGSDEDDSDESDDSDDSDGEDSDGDEDKPCVSRSTLQIRERKEKRENLFRDFKQARSKLESKQKKK